MKVRRLIFKELCFRQSGFLNGVIVITAATTFMVATVTLLDAHGRGLHDHLDQRRATTEQQMAELRDDYRRIMKDMGYNAIILHVQQDVGDFIRTGEPSVLMAKSHVDVLAQAPRASYNHLLPVLIRRTDWPERDVPILLCGTPGQVPVQAKPRFWTETEGYLDPIRRDIPAGHLEVGHGLAEELGLRAADQVTLRGRDFVIHRVLPPQGNMQDISIWLGIEHVQQWFDAAGRINAIFTLECMGDAPALGGIVHHVPSVLPDTQVVPFSAMVETRYHARTRAGRSSDYMMSRETRYAQRLTTAHAAWAAILLTVVLGAAGLWLFLLFLQNARRRTVEIGILRAIGVRATTIMALFMGKALLIGMLGAVPGYILGLLAGAYFSGAAALQIARNPLPLVLALLAAPLLCTVASWMPARWAAAKDPATVITQGL